VSETSKNKLTSYQTLGQLQISGLATLLR